MLTGAPKGTKDMMPDQAYKWHYIEKAFEDICRRYGFTEIRTPEFEHTELFKRGVGDTTDIVQKEMYTFEDYGGRSITLRPEGTSPVVRAYTEHKLYAGVQPSKFYYNISCFRYEKPQSGRLRAFHQFGIETFGTLDMAADAEIISLAHDFIEEMGITDVELRINSVGCPQCRGRHREALREFLKPRYNELCDTCKARYEKNPMRILDCKSPVCQEIVKGAPLMLDYLCDDCREAFEELKENLDAMGIEYTVDPGIVRGLDYYTKTAFEFVTTKIGAQGTVCGGGRYDHLVEEIGGPSTPGVGFGLGKERLLLTMESCGVELPQPQGPDVFIVTMGREAKAAGARLLRELRQAGLAAETDIMGRNMKKQLKHANAIKAVKAVIIGDEELSKNSITVKDMETSEQISVPMDKVKEVLTVNR
ncbi:MAG TPA: histidine--tRNA ligase [Candidatus Copromorpha excrementigallinarum]|uniref:Histidine--tRNA ligase n=1 Tax=Candidatus Allocopromorpha excrementigallinarum TaxID=2840742 RepID=A0A9D1L5W1_9FIRM|nr:histidine--tRNA ligase [Candidatus Copromorpha excrementigallinarum]